MNRVRRNLPLLALALSGLPACGSAVDADPSELGAPIEAQPEIDHPVHICDSVTCFFVTNTLDGGAGSLRQAIDRANAQGGIARIMFDIPGNGPHVIQPRDPLPALTFVTHVDGYSQPGARRATETSPPVLKIVVNGALLDGAWGFMLANIGNVVSGLVINGFSGGASIMVFGDDNVVKGNFIGVDSTGSSEVPNSGSGIQVFGSDNTIGGTDVEDRNVISGNGAHGVLLEGDGNFVHNNAIGTSFDGTMNLGNGDAGIAVYADGNEIGGTGAGENNLIAFNEGDGVMLSSGAGNAISRNSFFENGDLGIDLDADGPTQNDGATDPDKGPNGLQNFPLLQSATRDSDDKVTLDWLLRSTPDIQFRVEFFKSPACDASGHGEGSTFLGSRAIGTNATGVATNVWGLPGRVSAGEYLTAIAVSLSDGNTSEFSPCLQVL
jgi:hypothetical protein